MTATVLSTAAVPTGKPSCRCPDLQAVRRLVRRERHIIHQSLGMAPASRRSGLGSGVAGDGRRDRRARGARVADAGAGDRYESGYLLQRGRCAVPGANSGGKERAKSGANVTDARTPWRMRAFCPAEPLLRPGGRASPPGRRQGGRVAGHMCGERRSWRRSEGGAGEHCARAERSGARARLGRCMWEGHLSGRRAVAAPSTPLRRRRGIGGPRSGPPAFECVRAGSFVN